jgi:STE24 endopeptidase
MSVTPVEIDADRQQKAREYARIRHRLLLVDLAIAAIGVLIVLLSGLGIWLRNVLQPLTWQPVSGWFPWQVLLYFLILILAYQIINAPLSYYSGFVLPHRFGLSTMTLKGWLLDVFKGLALGLILEIFVIELVYVLLATQPQTWWLWVALTMLFFTVVMANLTPVLILPLFYKFTPLPEGELMQRLLALAERARTKVRGVFTMHMSDKTTAANAALMGLGNTRRIVLGDTMLDRYTPDEIEVVLAHELGHHVHHDIWKLIASQSVLTLGGLYLANLVLHWAVDTQHYYRSLADPATIPLILLLTAAFGLIVMPLSNGYSRSIEYQADEYALQTTRKVEPFKSAMTRLANQNLADVEPSPLIEFLLHDHPSIRKRLRHADEFAAYHGIPAQGSDFNASLSAPSSEAASSTDPAGMASSGSSTPEAAH